MKTWMVIGASSGIGRTVAEKLLARGDRVAAMARHIDALDALRAEHGERAHPVALDLTDAAAIRPAVDGAFDALGRIDIVFSNAGYGLFGAAEELTNEQVVRQIDTNLLGPMRLIRAALPHLRRQNGGRIVQTSAVGGQVGYPGLSAYVASKWGVEGYVESLALEVTSFGIDAILVEPGPTATMFGENADRAEADPAYADTAVGKAREALLSGAFAFTGDLGRAADAIIAAADRAHPPRRLILGKAAYDDVERALAERLAAVRRHKDASYAVDQ